MREQTVTFRLGAADTDSGEKHLVLGDLVQADNAYIVNRGSLSKRPPFTSSAITYSGGTLGTPIDIHKFHSGAYGVRDSSDQLWGINGSAGTLLGTNVRPWWDKRVVIPAELSVCRPRCVEVGANTWYFTVNNAASSYRLSIVSTATGETVLSPIVVSAGATVHNFAPIYDGTNVWVFIVSATTTIRAHKFVVATPTVAPTEYTYLTVSATTWTSIDAKWMPGANGGAGRCYVIAGSGNGSGAIDRRIMYSYLNAGTGAATSPTYLHTGTTSLATSSSSVAILEGQDGSAASWYFCYCAFTSITELRLCKVNSVAWTNTTSQINSTWPNGPHIASGMTTTTHFFVSIVGGYCSSATTQTMYAQVWNLNASTTNYLRNDELTVWRATFTNGAWDGSGPTDPNIQAVARGSWLASTPFQVGSTWYFMTGFDDGHSPTTANRHVQQCYHIRRCSDGGILAQVAVTEGAGVGHIEASATTGIQYTCVPRPVVSGTRVLIPAAVSNTNIAYCSGGMFEVDFDRDYGPGREAMGVMFEPGPIPTVWSSAFFHEAVPMLRPYYTTFSTTSTADYGVWAIRYVIIDPDGTQWRSPSMIITQTVTAGATATIPTLRHLLPGTTARIEIYLGLYASPTPKLQTTIANDSTANSTTYVIPATASFVAGETLSDFGGAISQVWPLPCTCVQFWRNRVFLGHDNHLHYSMELADGFGPTWNNSALSVTWRGIDAREIIGMGEINWDYNAVFAEDMIGVISGPGPDGLGRGAYEIQTIATRVGTVAPRSIVQGPDGCYFGDYSAGRICVITQALRVDDIDGIGRGTMPSVALVGEKAYGVWWEAKRVMLMLTTNYVYVIDYGNRTEKCPHGRMYRWTIDGYNTVSGGVDGPRPLCAGLTPDGPVLMNVNGDLYIPAGAGLYTDFYRGVTAPILRDVKTGPLQPANLQGEFDVSWIHMITSRRADCTMLVRVYPEYSGAAVESVQPVVTSSAQQFAIRPAGCARIQALAIRVTDVSPVGSESTSAADIDGFTLTIKPRGRAKMLNSGQVL